MDVMMMPRVPKVCRRFYSPHYKLQVVHHAEQHGNRPGERVFGVSEKLIRDWRKQKQRLEDFVCNYKQF